MHRHAIIASTVALALLCPTLAVTRATATRATVTPRDGRLAAASSSRVTGCGVERWSVKTGTDPDPDPRLVAPTRVPRTNIGAVRTPPAPGQPPLYSRVRPVETTV